MGGALAFSTNSDANYITDENIIDPNGTIIAGKRQDNVYNPNKPEGQYWIYHYDARGSVTNIIGTNASGALYRAENNVYDAFGKDDSGSATPTTSIKNEVKFTGAVQDSNGLYYLSSRHYDPNTGRFLQQDTVSGDPYSPWTQNLYTYTSNNPVNYIDPTGHFLGTLFAWVGKVVVGGVVNAVIDTGVRLLTGQEVSLKTIGSSFVQGCVETAVGSAATKLVSKAWGAVKNTKAATKVVNAATKVKDKTSSIAGRITDKIKDLRSSSKAIQVACFVAGTMVLSEDGYKAIETIEPGDKVYAADPETGEAGYKEVVRTFVSEKDEVVHVKVGGETITSTTEHPFYVPEKGWTAAIDLRAGDILVMSNGEYVVVEQVQHELLETPVRVYNFEVEDFHTYFVGDTSVLVHNACHVDTGNVKNKVVYSSRRAAFRDTKRKMGIPVSQQPIKTSKATNKLGKRIPGRDYIYSGGKVIRNHTAGHQEFNMGAHFNAIINNIKTHVFYWTRRK